MRGPVKISCFIAFFFNLVLKIVSQSTRTCLVERHMHNNGFHRNLTTKVIFPDLHLSGDYDCDILLIESLPASVYVDIHQLDFLKTGEDTDQMVHSIQEAAVEAPFHKAQPQEVYHWGKLKSEEESLRAYLALQVHLRYHRAAEERKMASTKVPVPKVLVRCEGFSRLFAHIPGDEVYSSCDNTDLENLCEWKEVVCEAKEAIKVHIPVGQRSHYDKVLLGTITLCSFYTFCLLAVVLKQSEHSNAESGQQKNKKL